MPRQWVVGVGTPLRNGVLLSQLSRPRLNLSPCSDRNLDRSPPIPPPSSEAPVSSQSPEMSPKLWDVSGATQGGLGGSGSPIYMPSQQSHGIRLENLIEYVHHKKGVSQNEPSPTEELTATGASHDMSQPSDPVLDRLVEVDPHQLLGVQPHYEDTQFEEDAKRLVAGGSLCEAYKSVILNSDLKCLDPFSLKFFQSNKIICFRRIPKQVASQWGDLVTACITIIKDNVDMKQVYKAQQMLSCAALIVLWAPLQGDRSEGPRTGKPSIVQKRLNDILRGNLERLVENFLEVSITRGGQPYEASKENNPKSSSENPMVAKADECCRLAALGELSKSMAVLSQGGLAPDTQQTISELKSLIPGFEPEQQKSQKQKFEQKRVQNFDAILADRVKVKKFFDQNFNVDNHFAALKKGAAAGLSGWRAEFFQALRGPKRGPNPNGDALKSLVWLFMTCSSRIQHIKQMWSGIRLLPLKKDKKPKSSVPPPPPPLFSPQLNPKRKIRVVVEVVGFLRVAVEMPRDLPPFR